MKKIFALILAVIMLLSLCACGAAKSESYDMVASEPSMSYAVEETAEMEISADEAGFGMTAGAEPGDAGTIADNGGDAPLNPDKIIYSANATVETAKFDETLASLDEMLAAYGAFVESSSISGNNYRSQQRGYASSRYASYCIRVPSDKFKTMMGSLSNLGNVLYSDTYTENITAQYYDTDARLTAYRTQEESLLAMLEKAETIEDIITIEDKLSEVRYRIESLQSTLRNWDRQVSYSTINLGIEEVEEYTPEVKISYGQRLVRAFKNALDGVGNFFENFLVFIVSALPTLVILGAVTWLVIFIIKKKIARRRAKRQLSAEQETKDE